MNPPMRARLITNSFCISIALDRRTHPPTGVPDLTACGYTARTRDLSRNTFEWDRFHVASYRITKAFDPSPRQSVAGCGSVLRYCLKCQSQIRIRRFEKNRSRLTPKLVEYCALTSSHLRTVNIEIHITRK